MNPKMFGQSRHILLLHVLDDVWVRAGRFHPGVGRWMIDRVLVRLGSRCLVEPRT